MTLTIVAHFKDTAHVDDEGKQYYEEKCAALGGRAEFTEDNQYGGWFWSGLFLPPDISYERPARRKPKLPVEGAIYFIQAENGLIKIGFSTNVSRRLETLQGMSPQKLSLLITRGGTKTDEAALHKRFERDRMHGEWFYPSDQLMQFIEDKIDE